MSDFENTNKIEGTAKIFNDMMNMKADNFECEHKSLLLGHIGALMYDQGITSDGKNVRYGDILCLLNFIPDSPRYMAYEHGYREKIRDSYLWLLLKSMAQSMESCEIVHKFMSLPINDYFNHLENPSENFSEGMSTLWSKALCCPVYNLSDTSTIKDLHDEYIRICEGERIPNLTDKEYNRAVRICKEDLYYFMIKYVRKSSYHDFFDMFYLKWRYLKGGMSL